MVCRMTSATVSRGGPAWRSMVTVARRGRPVVGVPGIAVRVGAVVVVVHGSVPVELGDGLRGAGVVDEGFAVGGGGHEGGGGSVVQGPGEAVGGAVKPGDGVVDDERVGAPREGEMGGAGS